MSEWPGGPRGKARERSDRGAVDQRPKLGEGKHWQGLKWQSDKWENKSSEGVRFYRGSTREEEGGGGVGGEDLCFFSSTYEIL